MGKPLSTEELAGRGSAHERTDTDQPMDADGKRRAEGPTSQTEESAGSKAKVADAEAGQREPLLAQPELKQLRDRWESIQTHFVDEPRRSVEQADSLVAELMQQLARSFAEERGRLEEQWEREEDVSTEELRVALTRYRSFFARLLAA